MVIHGSTKTPMTGRLEKFTRILLGLPGRERQDFGAPDDSGGSAFSAIPAVKRAQIKKALGVGYKMGTGTEWKAVRQNIPTTKSARHDNKGTESQIWSEPLNRVSGAAKRSDRLKSVSRYDTSIKISFEPAFESSVMAGFSAQSQNPKAERSAEE